MISSKEPEKNVKSCSLDLIHFDSFTDKGARTSSGKKIGLPKICTSSGFYLTTLDATRKGDIKSKRNLVFLGRAPLKGLQRYLAGKTFTGVGEISALNFTKEFQEKSFQILSSKETLNKELPLKTKNLIEEMRKSWESNKEVNICCKL